VGRISPEKWRTEAALSAGEISPEEWIVEAALSAGEILPEESRTGASACLLSRNLFRTGDLLAFSAISSWEGLPGKI
jgi:hypothetical protein